MAEDSSEGTVKTILDRIIMAEDSSEGTLASESKEPDYSSDIEFLASMGIHDFEGCTFEEVPRTQEDDLDEGQTAHQLLCFAQEHGAIPTKPSQPESEEGASHHQPYKKFGPEFAPFDEGNINPNFYKYTRTNEDGLIELDIKKLERRVLSLTLEEIANTLEKVCNVQSLEEKVLPNFKMLEKDETSAEPTESEEESRIDELETEELTPYNYERKNKLLDQKPHLREMAVEFLLHNFSEVNFTKGALETLTKSLVNHIELDLNHAISTLRRIAYPKLCTKHFSSEFPSGALEEDEPIENISISVDHFEFLQEKSSMNFLELFGSKHFQSFVLKREIDPRINNIVPSFIEFLENNEAAFTFPENCIDLILAVLKNPYRKIEVFYDDELPIVKEQMVIANFLVKCLGTSNVLDGKDIFEKLAEAIIKFANIHPSFLACIVGLLDAILSDKINKTPAYQIYCKVVNLMASIGATVIDQCLPQHFEKISRLATTDRNWELYFRLLRACEISIANTIEHESKVKSESSALFYTACYNDFGWDLTTRLIPVFKKFEKTKDREEQYLSKKHAIYPTKDGYMNTELRFLTRNGLPQLDLKSEFLIFPTLKVEFLPTGKVLFRSSDVQFGYVIKEDTDELSNDDDLNYWEVINEFPLSYLA